MSDVKIGADWWIASDGNWYPPELHPDRASTPPTPAAVPGAFGAPTSTALPQFSFDHQFVAPHAPLSSPPPRTPLGTPAGYGYGFVAPATKTNGLAIASLVCSIVCLVGIGSILGIIFGFVSRGQIKRSNGSQTGSGLALAGIIVGFSILTLVLLAIAVPTFLGVEHRAPAEQAVVHEPVTAITLGTPMAGSPSSPMVWPTEPVQDGQSMTPVPGGVDLLAAAGLEEWRADPVSDWFPSTQTSASVQIVGGATQNAIGLGCQSPSGTDEVNFVVYSSGVWEIYEVVDGYRYPVDSGDTSAINATAPNTLVAACQDYLASPGSTRIGFAINGVPVATDVIGLSSPGWSPVIGLCSCSGADTGRFLNVVQYVSPDTASTTLGSVRAQRPPTTSA
jgi:hypothetical protein